MLIKPSHLITDNFGLDEITPQATQVLPDVVDRRMRSGSLLITSQFPTDQWHGLFPDHTVADAILDHLVHQEPRITLMGESVRKLQAKLQMRKQ